MFREIGYKDRNYYYKDIRNIRAEIVFYQPVNPDALKCAVKKALLIYPHFAVRPVIKSGKLYYEDNAEDVVVIPEDGKTRYFGTDETNGYLFYLKYEDNRFMTSVFHGLTDHGGLMPFLWNIVYYYITEYGGEVPDICTRESETDEQDAFDPYAKYADCEAVSTWEHTDRAKSFMIPSDAQTEDKAQLNNFKIHIRTKNFIDLTHKWKTSFVPALISLISASIAEGYNASDESVVAYTTVNMRPVFDSKNQTNFSEIIAMPINKELRNKDEITQCKELRAIMDAQRTKQNFARIMASLISSVKKAEGRADDRPCKAALPIPTYLLTYPGRIDFPQGYEAWIKELNIDAAMVSSVHYTAIAAKTTGDDMQIIVRSDVNMQPLCDKLTEKLIKLGFSPKLEKPKEISSDLYSIDKLKKYEGGE